MAHPYGDPQPKPEELIALRRPLAGAFQALKQSAGVGDSHTFRLDAVDCADDALSDRSGVAAFTLRKMQALHYVLTPGVRTSNSVIVSYAAELNLSLTELAEAAEARGHEDAHRILINCRNRINEVSKTVASMNGAEVIELT